MASQRDYRADMWRLIQFKATLLSGAVGTAAWASRWWIAAVLVAAAAVLFLQLLLDCRAYGRLCRLDNDQRIRSRGARPSPVWRCRRRGRSRPP
jgi:hypothetical protein